MKPAIIIMAKVPRAGTVKTRLQSVLSAEKCAALASAFLADALEKAQAVCPNIILAYSPAGESALLKNVVSPDIILIEQTGANLGEKMECAFRFAFGTHAPVVMIGTDSPTFPARYLVDALDALEKTAEIVLGKSTDGGFYLIGLQKPIPNLFDRIAWSTPLVFEQITGNLKTLGIENLHLLPEHYDVDTPADFSVLKREIFADEAARKSAEKTYRWLSANNEIV